MTPKVGTPDYVNDHGTEDGWSRLQTPSPLLINNSGCVIQSERAKSPEDLSPKSMRKQSLKRLQQLIERNKNLAPHLRSSYVVEGLLGLETEICDENHLDPERAH